MNCLVNIEINYKGTKKKKKNTCRITIQNKVDGFVLCFIKFKSRFDDFFYFFL